MCLLDGTRVLFRSNETERIMLQFDSETEAVFRMKGQSRKDVFEFKDGRQIEVNQLPGLIFDVLLVPGKEHLSGLLKSPPEPEQADHDEPILARLRALIF